MLSRVRARLRSDSGFALIDVMVGVVVMALTVTGIATVSASVSSAMTQQATVSVRQSYLLTLVNQAAVNPASVATTTVTAPATVGGVQVSVSQLREDVATDRSVIRAAMPRGDAYDCSNAVTSSPSAADLANCLISETDVDRVARGVSYTPFTLTGMQAGIDGTAPAVITPGVLATFTPPAGVAATVNWVMGVVPGTGPARIVIYQGTTVLAVQSFESTSGNQYLYGTVPVTAGSAITFNWDGAAGSVHHFLVYK